MQVILSAREHNSTPVEEQGQRGGGGERVSWALTKAPNYLGSDCFPPHSRPPLPYNAHHGTQVTSTPYTPRRSNKPSLLLSRPMLSWNILLRGIVLCLTYYQQPNVTLCSSFIIACWISLRDNKTDPQVLAP